MVPEGKKVFGVHERLLIQNAEETIKGDPVLALVELITNSDDSYRKMQQSSGNIAIQVAPRRTTSSIYEVYDQAQGMNGQEMERKITIIGQDESGLTETTGGRSFFGRGLKECMIAFGKASVRSIKDGQHFLCTSEGVHVDKLPKVSSATQKDYRELQIPPNENGTRVRLIVENERMSRTPIMRNLAERLSRHYSLRDIMSNTERNIVLRYGTIDLRGEWHPKEEKLLAYQPPAGDLLLDTSVAVDGYPDAQVDIKVYRAHEKIPEATDRYGEERGFLICSKDAIHDVYDFGFGNHEAAGYIFGRVTCHYIDHLLRTKQEAVINASRDGVKWSHPFSRALSRTVEAVLRSLFQQEGEKQKSIKRQYENEETSRRVQNALNFLNNFVAEELEDTSGPGDGDDEKNTGKKKKRTKTGPRHPKRVPNGFAFVPPFIRLVVATPRTVLLKVELSDTIIHESVITLSSSTTAIQITDSVLHINDFLDTKQTVELLGEKVEVVTLKTQLSSDEVGIEGSILAKCNAKEALLEIAVIEQEGASGGLFTKYEFDREAPAQQRVQYVRGSGVIKIATQAPSIVKYFGPDGEGQDKLEARSLLAELILDACCFELARLQFSQEGFFLVDDDPAAISAAYHLGVSEYKNRLADKIHTLLISS